MAVLRGLAELAPSKSIFVQFQTRIAEGLVLSVLGEDGSEFVGQFTVTLPLGKRLSALRCYDSIVEPTCFGVGRS